MDFFSLLAFAGMIGLLFITIYVANEDDVRGEPFAKTRWFLYAVTGLTFIFGLMLLQFALIDFTALSPEITAGEQMPQINQVAALIVFMLCGFSAYTGWKLIGSLTDRERAMRVIGHGFNPNSTVHTTAIILALGLLCSNIGQFVLSGGIAGVAQSLENTNFVSEAFFQQVLWVFAALLGVGLFLRRHPNETLMRLGLRIPTLQEVTFGVGSAVIMFMFTLVLGLIWSLLVPPEQFADQTAASQQMTIAIGSMASALIVSLLVAVGEEIFFRGALQPIFGLWITSIFFTLLHIQYTLTPASVAILILALVLGVLRQRFNTTVAIITHFTFNFIQLALAILAASVVGGA